jgi:transposase
VLMLAETADFIIGVDTHKDTHSATVMAAGRPIAQATFAADETGYRLLLSWASRHAAGARLWAIEGTGSYGAGLTVALTAEGEYVREVDGVRRPRRGDKNDATDAARAAAEALLRELPSPRATGRRNALRMVLNCRKSAIDARTAALNELHALVVTAPETIRGPLRGKTGQRLHNALAELPPAAQLDDIEAAYAIRTLHLLASRISGLTADITLADQHLTRLLDTDKRLLAETGIGPVVAAQLLVSFSHPGRLRSEAAFAKLAGVSPLEASSGRTVRHRLNRKGDRKLNAALHVIARNRMRHDPETIAYTTRRRTEGKSDPEIIRCLKRALARRLYKLLNHTLTDSPQPNTPLDKT